MKQVQVEHLNSILETTTKLLTAKYIKGAEEHKTILSEDYTALQLVDFGIEEALDQITYLLTLKDVIKNAK